MNHRARRRLDLDTPKPEILRARTDWNTSTKITLPSPGDRMTNGTICAGISPHSFLPFYIAASDEPDELPWDEAMALAFKSGRQGLDGWRLPTVQEAGVIQAGIDKGLLTDIFTVSSGKRYRAPHWTCTVMQTETTARIHSFMPNGSYGEGFKNQKYSIRLVRG